MESQKLILLGARTFASEMADVVSEIPGFELAGFVENYEPQRCAETLEGLPVYWVDELAHLAADHVATCVLSTTHRDGFVAQAAAHGIRFVSLVHPSAMISSRSTIGEGSVLNRGVIVASHTRIGRHVILNRGAMIGHHTTVGDYASIQPGANIAGACAIGSATYVGMGAVVIDHLNIGAHSVIAAGAVVTQDVPDRVLVVGVPAKIVKRDIDGK